MPPHLTTAMPEPTTTTTTTSTTSINSNFLMNKYRILGKKGEGTFSEVLKCQNVKDGSYWACKKMKQHYESVEQVNNLREIQALRRLSPHSNILELHEVVFDKKTGTLVLVCELMDMNIYELIRDRQKHLHSSKIKNYMYQLCKSIDHMHRNGIFHRDVKPENILIKDDLLKLADFGSCRSVYSKQPYTEYISTRWYRAPECLLTDGYYTYKMDIWSVGCVFFEILSLHPLFPGSNEVDQIAKIHDVMGTPDPSILNKLRNKTRGMNFNFPQKKGTGIEKVLHHAPPECIELIYQMCAYDPDERISAKQALKHSYFKDLRTNFPRQTVDRFKQFREAEKRGGGGTIRPAKQQPDDQQLTTTSTEHAQQEEGSVKAVSVNANHNNQKEKEAPLHKNNTKDRAKNHNLEPVATAATSKTDAGGGEGEAEGAPSPAAGVTVASLPKKKASTSPTRAVGAARPASGGSNASVPRYPGSILHNRDPLYNYHRREKRRRRKMRMTDPSPVSQTTSGLLPKVSQGQNLPTKSLGYQPSFQFGPGTLPKIGGATNTTTTATFLPSLGQAFVKPAKPKQMAQAGAGQPTKNIFGHYQLPSIDRRGGGH